MDSGTADADLVVGHGSSNVWEYAIGTHPGTVEKRYQRLRLSSRALGHERKTESPALFLLGNFDVIP